MVSATGGRLSLSDSGSVSCGSVGIQQVKMRVRLADKCALEFDRYRVSELRADFVVNGQSSVLAPQFSLVLAVKVHALPENSGAQ